MAVVAWGFEAGDRTYYTQMGWTFSLGTVTVTTATSHKSITGHGGDYSLIIPNNTNALTPTFGTTGRWLHFWRGNNGVASSALGVTFRIAGNDTWHVGFNAGSGSIALRRGGSGGTLVQTDTYTDANFVNNCWIAIQLNAQDAGGTSEVWVNGVLVSTFTGDTKNAASANWDQVRFSCSNIAGGALNIDDVVITTSAEGRLTERFMPAQRPDGNDAVQFTPSAGTNWQNVDEVPLSTADYNSETVTGRQDTYTLTNLGWTVPASGVHCIVVNAYCSQEGGLSQAEVITKPTVTSFYATPVAMPASPTYGALTSVRNTNPDTAAAWAPADLDALNIGVRFTT